MVFFLIVVKILFSKVTVTILRKKFFALLHFISLHLPYYTMPQIYTKISNTDKKKICKYAQKNPTTKHKEIIAACFPRSTQVSTVTTISGILKKKEKYLTMTIDNISQ